MKDGIGEGFTREDHGDVSNQLFAAYSGAAEAKSLASVIGEEELSDIDKTYLNFGEKFENQFIGQSQDETRSIVDTLDIGWDLLRQFPKDELTRMDTEILNKYYDKNSQSTSEQEPREAGED